MHSLTDHSTPPSQINQHNRMHLRPQYLDNSQRQILTDPSLGHPESVEADNGERSGCGETFEIFRFSGGVVGDGAGGYVEAGETEEAGEGEDGEEELVEGGAEAEGEGYGCGGDAEGDLVFINQSLLSILFVFSSRLCLGGLGE